MAATKTNVVAEDASKDAAPQANVPPVADFSPSGAPRQVTDIDADHPAVDNNPRAGTTVDQNRIDFNDPTIDGAEAVKRNLATQSK